MMLAAVQATDERLIVPRYLMRISAHLAFSSSAQQDDSHWGPSPDCRAGVVTPLTPVVPQSPESDVQCAVKSFLINNAFSATESLLVSAVLYVFVRITVLSRSSRLQYDDAFTVLPCS